jgi:hypothetical protein
MTRYAFKTVIILGHSDHRTVLIGYADDPIAGLDAKAVEHSNERSTC